MQAVKGQDQTRQKLRDSEVSFQVLVEAVQDYAISRLDRTARKA